MKNSVSKSHNKDLAKNVKNVLKELGHDVPLGHAYELISRVSGYKNWDSASAKGSTLNPFKISEVPPDNENFRLIGKVGGYVDTVRESMKDTNSETYTYNGASEEVLISEKEDFKLIGKVQTYVDSTIKEIPLIKNEELDYFDLDFSEENNTFYKAEGREGIYPGCPRRCLSECGKYCGIWRSENPVHTRYKKWTFPEGTSVLKKTLPFGQKSEYTEKLVEKWNKDESYIRGEINNWDKTHKEISGNYVWNNLVWNFFWETANLEENLSKEYLEVRCRLDDFEDSQREYIHNMVKCLGLNLTE